MALKYTSLDQKDLDIVEALDKFGPKASTETLSSYLNIPSRTVRYRLAKLKTRGFLKPIRALTHERKIGLGEALILVQETNRTINSLLSLFEAIPCYSMVNITYGKYNGFLIHSFYSLNTPNMNLLLLKRMQENKLISDFFIFNIIDYLDKNINLTQFSPEYGWIWDCEAWLNSIAKRIQNNVNEIFNLESESKIIPFDEKDILLLRTLRDKGDRTLKELGQLLDLSESQVAKRIKRLQEERVIKKFRSSFTPVDRDEIIVFYLFLELEKNSYNVLSALGEIPNQMFINMETPTKYYLTTWLSVKSFNCFLKGIEYLKPYLRSYFIQFTEPAILYRCNKVYDLYNHTTKQWETPPDLYLNIIDQYSQSGTLDSV